jgi:hypothetical protein
MAASPINSSIDYTSRDYASLREDLIKSVQARIPDWTGNDPSDFGLAVVESFAYLGDLLSYYIDRAANEAFLSTATQRQNIVNIASTLGYTPSLGRSAFVRLNVTVPGNSRVSLVEGAQFLTNASDGVRLQAITFEVRLPITSTGVAGTISLAPTTKRSVQSFTRVVTTGVVTLDIVGDVVGQYVAGDTIVVTGTNVAGIDGTWTVSGIGSLTSGTTPISFTSSLTTAIALTTANASATMNAVNYVRAEEGATTAYKILGVSTGLPDQEFSITANPLIEGSTVIEVGNLTGFTDSYSLSGDALNGAFRFGTPNWTTYSRYSRGSTTVYASSQDNIYYQTTSANSKTTFRFGNGQIGRIPPKDSTIYATYRIGGGVIGNIASGIVLRGPGTLSAVADSNASGGVDLESTASIRRNAGSVFRSKGRAVSTQDFADLALLNTYIAKASARSGNNSSVTVYIAPSSSGSELAPGYNTYAITGYTRSGAGATDGKVTLNVAPTSTSILSWPAVGDLISVSGLGVQFDTGVSITAASGGAYIATSTKAITDITANVSVTYATSRTGSAISTAVSALGVMTVGVTDAMTSAMTTTKQYLESVCGAGTSVTVSPATYTDIKVRVTVFLEPNTLRSSAVRTVEKTILSLYGFNNQDIGGVEQKHNLFIALASLSEVGYSTCVSIAGSRSTSDAFCFVDQEEDSSEDVLTAGYGSILRLLTNPTGTWSVSTGGSTPDVYTNGNLRITIGGDTGIADVAL